MSVLLLLLLLLLLGCFVLFVATIDDVVDLRPQHPHFIDGVHQPHVVDAAACHARVQSLLPWNTTLSYHSSPEDEELQSHIRALQHNAAVPCDAQRVLLFALHSDCGFGAELHWLSVALMAAIETNRTLVIREDLPWIYAAQPFCERGHTFSCYFQPLSHCVVRSEADLTALLGGQRIDDVPVFTTKELHKLDAHRVVQYSTDLQKQLDFPYFRNIPARWARAGMSAFHWRSQLVAFIAQLNERVEHVVGARRDALGFNALNLVGIHTRRGDKLYGSAINRAETVEIPMASVFDGISELAVACGFDGVFVATKDGEFVDYVDQRVREAGAAMRLRWVIEREQPRKERGWSTHDLMRGMLNRTQEALDVITDMVLLASVQCLVGTFDSNLSRLAAELGEAWRSFEHPPLAFNGASYLLFP
jgi:hypothetical protein